MATLFKATYKLYLPPPPPPSQNKKEKVRHKAATTGTWATPAHLVESNVTCM